MQFTTRPQFPDTVWSQADLDEVAEFWLRLAEVSDVEQKVGSELFHSTEIRLWGVPRSEIPAAKIELEKRCHDPEFHIETPDEDTLVVRTIDLPALERPAPGLGIPILAGAPFDGLAIELRFRVYGSKTGVSGTEKLEGTLVLIGELRDGRITEKAVWREGPGGWEQRLMRLAPWVQEPAWRQEFGKFRGTRTVSAPLAKLLFPTQLGEFLNFGVIWLIAVPLERGRLCRLGYRLASFLLGFAGFAGFAYLVYDEWEMPLLCLPIGFFALFWGWLAYLFAKCEATLFFMGMGAFRNAFRATLDFETRYIPLAPDDPDLNRTPANRKAAEDIRALGGVHIGDVTAEPREHFGNDVYRVFLIEREGLTIWFAALIQTSTGARSTPPSVMWPANVCFLVQTFFEGSRFSTLTATELAFRRKLTGPEVGAQILPQELDTAVVLQAHIAGVKRYIAENNPIQGRVRSFADYLRVQTDLHAEERRLWSTHGYSLGDHLHWYLQWPRRIYRPRGT